MTAQTITGGCQCGSIRYRITSPLERAHICHCRMCQKAAGNYFMPFAIAPRDELAFTRGEPSWFNSSDPVRRGFCNKCGTPLLLDDVREKPIYVILGSLDNPSLFKPEFQCGTEAKHAWFDQLPELPSRTTEGDGETLPQWVIEIAESNHQHPDHDTDEWKV